LGSLESEWPPELAAKWRFLRHREVAVKFVHSLRRIFARANPEWHSDGARI